VTQSRGIRFATTSFYPTREGLLADAEKAESLGYDTFVMADHLFDQPAPIPTLMMVAEQMPNLRIGACVLCNDFRHPVIMAKEAATLDQLSGGRLELGLGAGYIPLEYRMAGIPFQTGRVRLERLAEAVAIVKLAFAGHTFSFDGAHYQVQDYTPYPRPVQSPNPPLMVGGGGPRLLALAAEQADIVSVLPASAPEGGLRGTELATRSATAKIRCLQAAAGRRWAAIETNVLIFDVTITNDRRSAAANYLGQLDRRLPQFALDGEITLDDLLDSPYVLFGTQSQLMEQLRQFREATGISYFTVFPHRMEAFAPVIHGL
jgi:probable F420-dependent oxidoreductase